jgi:hypothetical protein
VKAKYSPKLRSTGIDALFAIIEAQAENHLGWWQWDDTDEEMLREIFTSKSGAISSWIERYPPAWWEYIRLPDSRDWARLRVLTHQTSRPRFAPTEYDAGIRVGALVLWTSLNSISTSQETDTTLTLDIFVANMVGSMDNHVSGALPQVSIFASPSTNPCLTCISASFPAYLLAFGRNLSVTSSTPLFLFGPTAQLWPQQVVR